MPPPSNTSNRTPADFGLVRIVLGCDGRVLVFKWTAVHFDVVGVVGALMAVVLHTKPANNMPTRKRVLGWIHEAGQAKGMAAKALWSNCPGFYSRHQRYKTPSFMQINYSIERLLARKYSSSQPHHKEVEIAEDSQAKGLMVIGEGEVRLIIARANDLPIFLLMSFTMA